MIISQHLASHLGVSNEKIIKKYKEFEEFFNVHSTFIVYEEGDTLILDNDAEKLLISIFVGEGNKLAIYEFQYLLYQKNLMESFITATDQGEELTIFRDNFLK